MSKSQKAEPLVPRYGGIHSWAERKAFSDRAEEAVAAWFEARGRRVVPLAQLPCGEWRGPRLPTAAGEVIAPDLLVTRPGGPARFMEIKAKRQWTWYRLGKTWETGISLGELASYELTEQRTGIVTLLGFVMAAEGATFERGAPPPPDGFFIAPIRGLRELASHTWRSSGVERIFWAPEAFCRLCSLQALGLEP